MPREDHWLNRIDLFALSFLLAPFIYVSYYYRLLRIDDAYILLRYAKNLGVHHQLTWNLGAPPTEGYTSFLWVLLGAIPHALDFPVYETMQVLGFISGILLIVGTYLVLRAHSTSVWLSTAVTSQLALSPYFATSAVNGFATMTTAFLVFLSVIGLMKLSNSFQPTYAIGTYLILFISMLARPGIVVFAAGALAVLAVIYYHKWGFEETKRLTMYGTVFLFLPGVIYMVARYVHFEQLLPNPFLYKTIPFPIVPAGIRYTFDFVTLGLAPLLLLALFGLYYQLNNINQVPSKVWSPIGGATSLILFYFTIWPTQGPFWRFMIPIFPVLVLCLGIIINHSINTEDILTSLERYDVNKSISITYIITSIIFLLGWYGITFFIIGDLLSLPEIIFSSFLLGISVVFVSISRKYLSFRSLYNRRVVLILFLLVTLTIFPLHTTDQVRGGPDSYPWGMVQTGEALSPYDDDGHRAYVSESGAFPYASGWYTVDHAGLNNQSVVNNGPSTQFLRQYNPTLIMIEVVGVPVTADNLLMDRYPEVAKYLNESQHRLVAVVPAQNARTGFLSQNRYQLYFLDPSASQYQQMACDVSTIGKVNYASTTRFADIANISVQSEDPSSLECGS